MSFLGGGDASCSTAANPLSQFSKHVQDDKSLQRDRLVGRGPGGMQEGFRTGTAPGMQNEMMDEFMQQPGHAPQAPPFAMEQMRREFEQLHATGAPQTQQNGSQQYWAGEFDHGAHEQAFQPQKPGGFDPAEFDRYVQMRQNMEPGRTGSPSMSTMNGYQRPMGMNFGGMGYGGMGMGMGMGMQRPFGGMGMQEQPEVQGKGKGRMVELDDKDWEAQFAELETTNGQQKTQPQSDALDEEAQRAMEAELEELDRSVPKEKTFPIGDFESVWRKIQAETPELANRNIAKDVGRHSGDYDDWENFDMNTLNTHLPRDPELGNYLFETDNIFTGLANPFEEGIRIMDEGGNLSLAALAFEAAVQKDPSHVAAWTRLGASQAQNEKETPAIRALEQAIKLDPQNLEALMGLAVSYTNEGYDTTAYRTLERWLGTKYPSLAPPGFGTDDALDREIGFTGRHELHERVTELFIKAAQLSPSPEAMDPDVQVGLGVLFYGAEEYDKAVDCFSAALHSSEAGMTNSPSANQRPLLWNRLGATLANSGKSEEAIDAYEQALALNPNFVRARYNLGVSCINIGCTTEAAQHLLGALDMHKMVEREGREKAREIVEGGRVGGSATGPSVDEELDRMIRHNQSTNLYDTLRRVFSQMDRRDLADRVGPGMDPATFRNEFDF